MERNRIKPDYFFPAIAKETGYHVDDIKKLYSAYTGKLNDACETEPVINIWGLGRFETDIRKCLYYMNFTVRFMNKYVEKFKDSEMEEKFKLRLKEAKHCVHNLFFIAKDIERNKKSVLKSFNDLRSRSIFYRTFFNEEGGYIGEH